MIIGITGTLGAGKGTVAVYLTKKHNFTYFSVRNFLAAEVLKRGKIVNRDTITETANALRAEHGAGYVTQRLLAEAISQKNNVVIESIRTVGEAKFLKSHGAQLWAVDADLKVRYNRIVGRASETEKWSRATLPSKISRQLSHSLTWYLPTMGRRRSFINKSKLRSKKRAYNESGSSLMH
jgi:dephospho-CoA kinase